MTSPLSRQEISPPPIEQPSREIENVLTSPKTQNSKIQTPLLT